jgi:hypothetical protein
MAVMCPTIHQQPKLQSLGLSATEILGYRARKWIHGFLNKKSVRQK